MYLFHHEGFFKIFPAMFFFGLFVVPEYVGPAHMRTGLQLSMSLMDLSSERKSSSNCFAGIFFLLVLRVKC